MSQGYPEMWEVEQANQLQLMKWSRYLPSPNEHNRPILDFVLKRQAELRALNPEGYTAASKAVGWDG